MMMKKISILLFSALSGIFFSCDKYLDVVPDNVATIDYAFNLRASAEKYLFTCYSYMPDHGHFNSNPAFMAADEIWNANPPADVSSNFYNIALGLQNVSNPFGNFWSGSRGGKPLFQGIRDCNIFLENIDKVEEMDVWEKERWKAEATFLKAYYHFYLMRMYGAIPIMKENLPIAATPDEVQVYRQPVDTVVSYVVQLLDEAYANPNLPETLGGTEQSELGRITKPIVLALKAKVLVTAASPLFNGNPEYADLKDNRGVQLFSSSYDVDKWVRAAAACKEAIDYCHSFGYGLSLNSGLATYTVNDTIEKEMRVRTAITMEGTTEVIWPNTNSMADVNMQRWSMGIIKPGATSNSGPKGILAPTIKMAEMFYTEHGLPITDDKTWDYAGRYELATAGEEDRFYIALDSNTVKMHFDREPRFYASLGFDRGIWFGNWVDNYDVTNDLGFIRGRSSEISARQGISNYTITGYWIKKLVNIETFCAADGNITNNIVRYPWPEIRMSDLYLLYAEALNEVGNGYTPEITEYINLVRSRTDLPTVEEAWDQYSTQPGYYNTKENLRNIIKQERAIELAFEGHRFWDLLRWKDAHRALNQPVKGWDITQKSANSYYRPVLLFNQHFTMKEYLWPIEIDELQINRNLVQNPGW
ncbi:RagB/SusD family nutrient uptake outer membrane protein [Parapedobacter soli]|uniref:RagB/SusD family nutrient uptake outer membrane protein n=1 Tax=Parapedobacter soli TaxID=416955 RepID=UPI0021C923A6|nr:RagB/SusD family nutrient uptake outer membrane protein [Parapedobacter soli]